VKLLTEEPGSEAAMAHFRRLDFPPLFFLPLQANSHDFLTCLRKSVASPALFSNLPAS
jgi:hypothetical protein